MQCIIVQVTKMNTVSLMGVIFPPPLVTQVPDQTIATVTWSLEDMEITLFYELFALPSTSGQNNYDPQMKELTTKFKS